MNSNELKGLPVLSIADGEQLGTVARTYLDIPTRRIIGFALHTKTGVFEPEFEPKIDTEKVHTLGSAGLLLDDKSATHGATIEAKLGEVATLDDLASRPVLTEDGVALGHVASINFDEQSYALTGIETSLGLLKSNRTVAIGSVVTIGSDYLIVASAVTVDDAVPKDQPVTPASTSGRIRRVEAEQPMPSPPSTPAVEPSKKPARTSGAKRTPKATPE